MPAHRPLHDELLSDDDPAWRRHILWQSAALAPNAASDLELNKAVEEVGGAARHFADTLPPRLQWLFVSCCIVCAAVAGVVSIVAARALLGAAEVDAGSQQHLHIAWVFVTGVFVLDLAVLLTFSIGDWGEANACPWDRWFALDLVVLALAALSWFTSQQSWWVRCEACASILAVRFALQPFRISYLASASLDGDRMVASVRCLRPKQQCSALDTDLGFDNTRLPAWIRRPDVEAKQDSGVESGSSCCSSSELKAERALEAKEACELDLPSFEFDDIDSGWVCVACNTLNVGEDRRSCEYCEASPTHGSEP